MQIDNNITSLEIADKTIVHFNDFEMTGKWEALRLAGFTEHIINQNDFLIRPVHQAINLLADNLQYIEQTGNSGDWFFLTDLGRKVKKAGGHFEYLKKLEEKTIADTERQNLNDEKLKYDVKNSKRIFKTYWWTFGISILAFLLALGKIIYDVVSKAK